MITSYSRGHIIYWKDETQKWYYEDNNTIHDDSRPCKKCNCFPTKDGHDACIANLPGIKNACCGHNVEKGYKQKEEYGESEDL